jgi:hypothetical protein
MSESGSGPVPNERVLTGISANPPSLTGDLVFGILAAWADPSGQIYLASSQDSPPYQPRAVNPSWITRSTPAVALALEWGRIYLAWTDPAGVHLANSGDGWGKDILIPAPVNTESGPALAFTGDILYIAWQANNSLLWIATCDFDGNIQARPTESPVLSGPSLTWSNGNLYALAGGPSDRTDDMTVRIYLSTDGGGSFNYVPSQSNTSVGAPALAIVNGVYYLAWADGQTSYFNAATTTSLEAYTTVSYDSGCHNGGPALLALPDGLLAGWSFGAASDPRAHHITLGQLPLHAQSIEGTRSIEALKEYIARIPSAPNPCPDPSTIYDPAQDKCVPRGGCYGSCVLRSFTTVFLIYLVFNPILYAICVINCKKSGSLDRD